MKRRCLSVTWNNWRFTWQESAARRLLLMTADEAARQRRMVAQNSRRIGKMTAAVARQQKAQEKKRRQKIRSVLARINHSVLVSAFASWAQNAQELGCDARQRLKRRG